MEEEERGLVSEMEDGRSGMGSVTGDGGFAYAAFGRGDGDDVCDAGDGALLREAALETGDGAFLGEALSWEGVSVRDTEREV